MIKDRITSKRASVNGVTLHYVTVGSGPTVLCLHGWPQNHREFVPIFECFAERYRFIVPDLRGYADSDKPYADYLPATIAQDLIELVDAEGADRFHVLSHDLGGPPAVALAYMAGERAILFRPSRPRSSKDVRDARGITLLRAWLSPMQRAQFDASKSFDVVGCDSGRRYRILYGRVTNVHEIDDAGQPVMGWCFAPSEHPSRRRRHACSKNRARDK
jgi:pimeloyl-ACP methyl ester carboxylesterase